jgi:hypothetical protein
MPELLRQSPALAMAQQMLRGDWLEDEREKVVKSRLRRMPQYKPGEEPTLADKFIASTYTLGAAANQAWKRKRIDEVMLQQRVAMRKAHRFVLDSEFVEHATRASTVDSKKLLARLQFATLPYETTWIEFDLHTKIRVLQELHKIERIGLADISPRLGILLQRIDDTTGIATLVSEAGDSADMHLLSHCFSMVERTYWPPFNGHEPLRIGRNVERDQRLLDHANGGMWGYTQREDGGMLWATPGADIADLHTPVFLQRHGHTATGPLFGMYRSLWGDDQASNQRLADLCKLEITEFAGHMRWLVTVLAMLNEVPLHANYVMPMHQQRVDRTRKVKFVDYHKVTLRLPKLRPIPYIERHINGDVARRHRAHEVRAHWRTYLHEQHCAREEHTWEYDHENGYRLCGKCMAYSRLIHEHVRGDATLGWIRKDYVIKKEQQA